MRGDGKTLRSETANECSGSGSVSEICLPPLTSCDKVLSWWFQLAPPLHVIRSNGRVTPVLTSSSSHYHVTSSLLVWTLDSPQTGDQETRDLENSLVCCAPAGRPRKRGWGCGWGWGGADWQKEIPTAGGKKEATEGAERLKEVETKNF